MAKKEAQNFNFMLVNRSRSTNFFLLFIFSGIIFTGLAFYLISQENAYPLIIEVILAIAYFILLSKIKPSFFEFLVFDDHFSINYYPVATVSRDYQSIEVPLTSFSHFAIRKSVFGLKKDLVISVFTPYGIAEYPSISVSILSKKEMASLVHVLKKLTPQKREEGTKPK